MNFGLIKNDVCINAIVLEAEPSEEEKSALIPAFCDDVVALRDGFGIGDRYINGAWSKAGPESPAERRKQAYGAMLHKADGSVLITWSGNAITVDQANKVYMEYFAEGRDKAGTASEIQTLIVLAKAYIRELYPNE